MPKQTPPDVREIEEFWRDGQDARAFGESSTQRERLLIELVFAARSLATRAIRRRPAADTTGANVDRFIYDCRECFHVSMGPGPLEHSRRCNVGRVLAVIDDIQSFSSVNVPKDAEPQGGGQ